MLMIEHIDLIGPLTEAENSMRLHPSSQTGGNDYCEALSNAVGVNVRARLARCAER